MLTILLTGFEPFGDFKENPTQKIIEEINFVNTDALEVHKLVLPVDFDKVLSPLEEALTTFQPNLVISLGLQANIGQVKLEQVALNVGFDRYGAKTHFSLLNEGSNALMTRLNLDQLADELCEQGIPTLRSNHAGTYLCNGMYYHALQWCAERGSDALFVHLPYTTEMAAQLALKDKKMYPSLPKNLIFKTIRHIIWFYEQKSNLIA